MQRDITLRIAAEAKHEEELAQKGLLKCKIAAMTLKLQQVRA